MTIGKTSDITAAILKTLKLFIVGSICGTEPNPFEGRTFPSPAPFVRASAACQSRTVRGMNGLRRFRDNRSPPAATAVRAHLT
jgi:hypothetical protein